MEHDGIRLLFNLFGCVNIVATTVVYYIRGLDIIKGVFFSRRTNSMDGAFGNARLEMKMNAVGSDMFSSVLSSLFGVVATSMFSNRRSKIHRALSSAESRFSRFLLSTLVTVRRSIKPPTRDTFTQESLQPSLHIHTAYL